MQSATSFCKSCFYPALWKKNMTRFWPLWVSYTIILLFLLPLHLAVHYMGAEAGPGFGEGINYFSQIYVLRTAGESSILLVAFFAIFAAMAVFSYLYQGRSVDMLHSLPVRRTGLFFTNYLSGLSFLVLPAGLVYLITLMLEAARGCLDAGRLTVWLACMVLYPLFFYSFAVFCAMFTGHILALPVFYGILNGLAAGVHTLINWVLEEFVFGFVVIDSAWEVVMWLTPLGKLIDEVGIHREWDDAVDQLIRVDLVGFGTILVYAVVGLVLTGLALAIYHRRHLELAGDVVAVHWVQPIFKYGVAACVALAGGSLLYSWFGRTSSGWMLLAYMLLCGVIGYYGAQMLLKKSFRVFRQGSWKGCVVLLLCLTAGAAALELDLSGFERRVPQVDQVEQVRIQDGSAAPYDSGAASVLSSADPEFIALVTQLHQAVIADYRDGAASRIAYDSDLETGENAVGNAYLQLTYTLKNGSTVKRNYSMNPVTSAMLADPATSAAQLQAIINRPEVRKNAYFPENMNGWRTVGATITTTRVSGIRDRGRTDIEISAETQWYRDEQIEIPEEGWEDLLAAVQSDLAAGRLGRRYLIDDAQRLDNCYFNDISFNFYLTGEATQAQEEEEIYFEGGGVLTAEYSGSSCSVNVTVQASATDTLAVLEELGLTGCLITQGEMQDLGY